MPQSLPGSDHVLWRAPTLLRSTDSAGSSAFAQPPPFASAIPFLPRGARRSYSNRYHLFASVDRHQARTLLALVVAGVPIAFLVTLNKLAPIILLGDAGFLKAFEPAQLQTLAMLFIELHKYGILIVSVFWGLWLLPLGILAYKSGFFPRIFGILLIVNFASYMVNEFLAFLFPEAKLIIAPVMTVLLAIGEIPFLFWLLVRGARNPA